MTDANYILTKLNHLDDSLFTSWSEKDIVSLFEIYVLISIHEPRLVELFNLYDIHVKINKTE